MKKKTKVLSRSIFPARLPVWPTLYCFLAVDYYNAPEWIEGAVGLLILLIWITSLIKMFNDEQVDIFEEKEKTIEP